MMAVNQVIIALFRTLAVNKQHAAVGVIAVEITVEIILGVAGRIHDGVIDLGALDLEPAEEIGILLVQLVVLSQSAVVICFVGILYHLRKIVKGVLLARGVEQRCDQHISAADKTHDEYRQKNDNDSFTLFGILFRSFGFCCVSHSSATFVRS